MAFIGMPGPLEILILAGMCGLPVIIVLVVLALAMGKSKGNPAGPQVGPECPSCGGWTVPQANYCQWCGKTLGTAPGAR